MSSVSTIPTPAFVVDLPQAKRNCLSMLQRAQALNVKLRPHVKTHKTLEIGLLQLGWLGPGHEDLRHRCTGVVTSTLAEMRFFAQGDRRFADVLYGLPLCQFKIPALLDLHNATQAKLHVLVDQPETLDSLIAAVKERKDQGRTVFDPAHPLGVFIKIDAGYHRAGLDPTTQLAEIEALVATILGRGKDRVSFSGLYSHSGNSYTIGGTRESIAAVALEEAWKMATLFRHLEGKGYPPPAVSIGATPSCSVLPLARVPDVAREEGPNYRSFLQLLLQHDIPWELHPGNYALYDVMQQQIGSCSSLDIACKVMTRVVSVYPARRQFLIDAGGAAISKDHLSSREEWMKWGVLQSAHQHGFVVRAVSQECAVVDMLPNSPEPPPRVGAPLELFPVHSCMAAMCHPHYYVTEKNERNEEVVVGKYTPCKHWV